MSHIEIIQGDEIVISVTWADSSGEPINITTYTLSAKLVWRTGSHDLTLTKTSAVDGEFELSAIEPETEDFPVGALVRLNIIAVSSTDVRQTIAYRVPVRILGQ